MGGKSNIVTRGCARKGKVRKVNGVTTLFESAVAKLLQNDRDLLCKDVAERAITHRLAFHLAGLFDEWHVDCEYNRDIDTIKRLKFAIEPGGNIRTRAVLPDILVHKRGCRAQKLYWNHRIANIVMPHTLQTR